jgi:hypothetical protein
MLRSSETLRHEDTMSGQLHAPVLYSRKRAGGMIRIYLRYSDNHLLGDNLKTATRGQSCPVVTRDTLQLAVRSESCLTETSIP